jgi:hypothetical protein
VWAWGGGCSWIWARRLYEEYGDKTAHCTLLRSCTSLRPLCMHVVVTPNVPPPPRCHHRFHHRFHHHWDQVLPLRHWDLSVTGTKGTEPIQRVLFLGVRYSYWGNLIYPIASCLYSRTQVCHHEHQGRLHPRPCTHTHTHTHTHAPSSPTHPLTPHAPLANTRGSKPKLQAPALPFSTLPLHCTALTLHLHLPIPIPIPLPLPPLLAAGRFGSTSCTQGSVVR